MGVVRKIVGVAVFLAVLIAGWMFAHGNDEPVSIDYVLGRTPEVALWKALVVAAVLGGVGAVWLMGWRLLRSRLEARRYRKAMLELESEVHQLRNLPVVGGGPADSATVSAVAGGGAIQKD
jgi:uncharacterized integral membrane protein